MDQPATERREVVYAGRVQGVGFRYTVRSLAARLPLSGYVRNLPNGRVQLVVEGLPGDIDALLAAIRDAMRGYISGREERVREASGEFRGFEIRA
ncbi:MAG: acylphosphatase [Planctomycetota bacterium]